MKRALLIGINYTNTPQCRLSGCIDDVVDIQKVLIDQYKYLPENIVMLRDDSTDPTKLPTCANMMKELITIMRQSSSAEEIWIHYSGHGSQIPDQNTYKQSKLDDIIVPMDYQSGGFICDGQLFSIIRNIKCRSFLFFDCCHSGSVCDLPWTFEFQVPESCLRNQTHEVFIDNPNIFMMSGCKDTETSADSYDYVHREPAGAFTCALIATLEEGQYTLHIMELYKKVCIRLYQQGFMQHPVFSSSHPEPAHTITRAV